MKRRLLLIFLLLLGGAIVNVAVAWGCGLWSEAHYDSRKLTETEAAWLTTHDEHPALDPRTAQNRDGIKPYLVNVVWGRGFTCENFLLHSADLIEFQERNNLKVAPAFEVYVFRSGLPALSVSSEKWDHSPEWVRAAPNRSDLPVVTGGLFVFTKNGLADPRFICWRPIWPGFAINTLFYAFVLWLLFAAPFALRRRRRIKRGLCVKCGYDLRKRPSDSSVCPECGAPGW